MRGRKKEDGARKKMEQERSSGNQKVSLGKENDVRLKVFCLTPSPTKAERDTSVYEINIESDFRFCTPGKKRGKMMPVKESVAAFGNKDKEARNKKNPFLDSYYPSIVEIHPDINEKAETDVEFAREEKKNFVEKVDKESQYSTRELPFEKNMKNIVLDNFISKHSKDWKTILENGSNELEKSELHLHHHEHHHYHYYYHHDDKSILSERIPSSNPTRVFSARTTRTENRSPERRCQVEEKQISRNRFPTFSNTTFTKSLPGTKPEEPPVTKIPKQAKSSASVESVFLQKSDFIKSHTYSDRDMTKYESEEAVTYEINSRPSKKSNKSTFSTVLSSLKNLNDFKSPVIITDQESIPKLSYITCECRSSETLSQSSDISTTNSVKTGENVEDSSFEGDDLSGLTGTSKRSNKLSNQVWNAKVIEVLKQIREELIRLQKKHSKKKKSELVKSGGGKPVPHSDSSHRVIVSSCKTFVFIPELLDRCSQTQRPMAEGSFKRLDFREVELNSRSVCLLKRKEANILREIQRPNYGQAYSSGFRSKLFV